MLSEPSRSPLASAPSKLIFQTFPKHQRHSLLCNDSLVQIWIHLGSGSDSLDRPAWRPVVRTAAGDWVSQATGYRDCVGQSRLPPVEASPASCESLQSSRVCAVLSILRVLVPASVCRRFTV